MKKSINILNGNINTVLISLALPMIAANFVQTAFGLIDMAWIGSLGSQSVSAVGSASFYLNLATAISTLITVGVGVKYAQHIGSKETGKAEDYIKVGLLLSGIVSLLYVSIMYVFAKPLIGFFNIQDAYVVELAIKYLRHSLPGMPFLFFSLTLTSLLTSKGKTKSVFVANTTGLILNMILDPLFIFGVPSFIPSMGVTGAAWATNIARAVTFILLFYSMKNEILKKFKITDCIKDISTVIKMGLPVAIQRIAFIFISMYLARIIAQFGNSALAAQKIGVQIESISYVTIGGLQGALAAFIGQNYGAKSFGRVKEGYSKAIRMAVVFSLIVTTVFLLFPRELFSIFIKEEQVIEVGIGYMRAIGISQLFMCVEYITVGVFNGIGKTYIPPVISIVFTALRIPMAIYFIQLFGINGVWMSISISSILKGSILFVWMKVLLSKGEYNNETYEFV